MAERTENVGIFTAYGFAREGGYVGTKAEFEEGLAKSANYATNAQASATAAANSATAASGSATAAAGSASTAAGYAQDADEAAQAAAASADEAEEYAESIDPDQFAKIDGYYGTLKSGESDTADNLTPYSEDSGTSQNTPFILQGSGCANGEEQADTGSYCQLQRKNGNTVVVNQLIANPTFTSSGGWASANANKGTIAISNGELAYTVIEAGIGYENGFYSTSYNIPIGHKLAIIGTFKASRAGIALGCDVQNVSATLSSNLSISYETVAKVIEKVSDSNGNFFCTRGGAQAGDIIYAKEIYLIDLTLWFGSNDKIPTHLLNHPEDFFRYYQGSLAYNAGTLTDCNGRYLKTWKRNVWDEEWEVGGISSSTGANSTDNTVIRSKNYIRIVPNEVYYLYAPQYCYFRFYDANKNYIGYLDATGLKNKAKNETFVTPSNAIYFRFVVENVTTYGNNITPSLYYEGESGYDQYYPYEELANIDTGNEPLLAFDYKTPDGVVHKETGRVDLGTLTWLYNTDSASYPFFTTDLPNGSLNNVFGGICAKYECVEAPYTYLTNDKMCGLYGSTQYSFSRIAVRDSAYTDPATFKTAMSGVYIEYELADASKTTEQGTPFPENVAIDDFGTMSFDCPNGVPQGNLIFYPVDYKAEFDTLHNITDGDMHKIALKGELAPTDPDTIKGVVDYTAKIKNEAQDACGGTLRLLLSVSRSIDFSNTAYVDMGDLDWSVVEGNAYANCQSMSLSSVIKIDTSADYIYSTKYKAHSSAGAGSGEDMQIYISSAGGVRVNDFALNGKTAAQIKDAMNGVLLAYEKATT